MPIQPTVVNEIGQRDGSMILWKWVLLTATPDGTPVQLPEWADRTWTVGAAGDAFGGATVAVEGSNDGVTFYGLNDAAGGAALTIATPGGCKTVIQNPLYMRPNLSVVGAGASITVYLLIRRAQPLRA